MTEHIRLGNYIREAKMRNRKLKVMNLLTLKMIPKVTLKKKILING